MKKLIYIIVSTILLTINAFALEPTDKFFVNDYANVLSDSVEDAIYKIGGQLANQTYAQVVVITVDSLDGKDIESFAYELGEQWGVGDKNEDTGVVMLLAIEERQSRIEVGYGLEGALPDIQTGIIQDKYMIPYFKDDDFATGMLEGYKAIVTAIYKEYGIEPDPNALPKNVQSTTDDEDDTSFFKKFGLVIIIILIIIFSNRNGGRGLLIGSSLYNTSRHTRSGGFRGGGFGGGGGFSGGGGGFGGGGSSRNF